MDADLRQVTTGFDFKVRSFDKYDINGYRFRTYGKQLSMADQKSTNCCVSAIGEGDTKYYMEELKQFMNFNSMVQKPTKHRSLQMLLVPAKGD
mgnify:CR=1 FL=1